MNSQVARRYDGVRMRIILWLLVFALVIPCLAAQDFTPLGYELTVLEVKTLTEKEAVERTPQFVGPNLVIRLRLANKSNDPVLLLVTKDTIDPLSCVGRPNRIARECRPKLLAIPNQWLALPPGAALEWEEMDSTVFSGQDHIVSVSIKRSETANPEELDSALYKVPAPIYTPKKDEHEH